LSLFILNNKSCGVVHALAAVGLPYAADDGCRRVEQVSDPAGFGFRADQDKTDAQIECAAHLVGRNTALIGEPFEDRRRSPAAHVDLNSKPFRYYPDDVLGQPTAGDMGHAAQIDRPQQALDGADIDFCWSKQRLTQCSALEVLIKTRIAALDDFPDQRVAVTVRAAGGQSDQHAVLVDTGSVDQLIALDRTNRKARQIVLACAVHSRHFSGLAADQRTSRPSAALGDSGNNGRCGVYVQLAAGEIVEKEQRFCAADQNVVDAHGHEVNADAVVDASLAGQQKLGPHAVGTRHQHRVTVALAELEQTAKSAETGHHFRPRGRSDQRFNPFNQRIACVNIHTGIPIAERSFAGVAHSITPLDVRTALYCRLSQAVAEGPCGIFSRPMNSFRFLPFLAFLLALSALGDEAFGRSLYTGEAPLPTEETDTEVPLNQAFDEVLTRLTGITSVSMVDRLALTRDDLQRMVLSQQRVLRSTLEADGLTVMDELYLRVEFDPGRVDALLAEAGVSRLGPTRPSILLWLAVEDDEGIGLEADPFLEQALERQARRLGLEVLRPIGDLQDLAEVQATDIRGGFLESATLSAERYGAGVTAMLDLRQSPSGWNARWFWRLEGRDASLAVRAAELETVVAQGMEALLGVLVDRFGRVAGVGQVEGVRLTVEGIEDEVQFAEVLNYLDSLGLVDDVQVVAARGTMIDFEFQLTGAGFEDLLAIGNVLEPVGNAANGQFRARLQR